MKKNMSLWYIGNRKFLLQYVAHPKTGVVFYSNRDYTTDLNIRPMLYDESDIKRNFGHMTVDSFICSLYIPEGLELYNSTVLALSAAKKIFPDLFVDAIELLENV